MKKLKKFNKTNKKNIMPLVALCAVVAIVSAAISYAVYQKEDEVLFINAKVGEFETTSSDIELAMKLDGEDVDVLPSKGDYSVTVECDHADGSWNMDEWGADIRNITSNRVKCNVSFETLETLSSIVELGDYISMTPTSTSYTPPSNLTGCLNDSNCIQNIINPSELNLWRVIKKNEDGTVDMVSDKVSSTTVYFKGKTGYINFIKGLNTIASQYTDGKHVERTRHIGYSNQTETLTDTSALSKTAAPWTKKTSVWEQWTGCDTSSYLCGTDETKGAGDIGYETDYQLVNAVYGNMIGKNPSDTDSSYWLASRLFYYIGPTGWNFRGRWVNSSGDLKQTGFHVYGGGFYDAKNEYAVRPVVTLKLTTEILSGDGTSNSPYNLA